MMTEREFIEIKGKIETKKEEITRANGKLEQLMSTLKNDYGCETIEDAEKKVDQLNIDLEEKSRNIEELESSLLESMKTLSA